TKLSVHQQALEILQPGDIATALLELREPAGREVKHGRQQYCPKPDTCEAIEAVVVALVQPPDLHRYQVKGLEHQQMQHVEEHRRAAIQRKHLQCGTPFELLEP